MNIKFRTIPIWALGARGVWDMHPAHGECADPRDPFIQYHHDGEECIHGMERSVFMARQAKPQKTGQAIDYGAVLIKISVGNWKGSAKCSLPAFEERK
jgi:hypothetical protein